VMSLVFPPHLGTQLFIACASAEAPFFTQRLGNSFES
jgi:hypothetical protein